MMKAADRGATLVELVITIVIIGVAIAGVTSAFSLIVGRSADPLNQTRAVALAQFYFDEIASRRYSEGTAAGGIPKTSGCTIVTEEADRREDYDDVDDYDFIDDQVPSNADGTALNPAAYGGFRVSVEITCAGDEVGLPDVDAKRVDITITHSSGDSFLFSGYRANY